MGISDFLRERLSVILKVGDFGRDTLRVRKRISLQPIWTPLLAGNVIALCQDQVDRLHCSGVG